MERTGLAPGQRLLLVVAVVLGVLTMHATPVLCAPASDDGHVVATSHPHAGAGAAIGHGQDPDCGSHHALAACLAILAMGMLLLALRLLGWMSPGPWRAARVLLLGPVVGSRAPPRASSTRLAELCVSRR
ncbi:DUF6153 family protein [Pseudonocardia sp.]|uniref:DUF6153 family protein n=1 Tax=Pseudonocardia sp. TaxID=60912 RepID=UPI003D15165E